MAKTSPQKGRRYPKEIYTSQELRSLLGQAGDTATGDRNRALILTLWQSGIRIGEALKLKPEDVSADGELFVREAKGGKRYGGPANRRVRCGREALEAIHSWLSIRQERGIPPSAPVFCTLKGRPVYGTYVRAMLTRLAQQAGWTKRVHPHGFRHTFAVTASKQGMPAAILQRQLGHTSLHTTTIYLSGISTEDIAEAMEKIEW